MPEGQEQRDRWRQPEQQQQPAQRRSEQQQLEQRQAEQQQAERFGGLLRALRLRNGLTQEALAEASGSSVRTIREMEHGRVRTPQRRTAALLADALGLDGAERSRFLALAARVVRHPRQPWEAAQVSDTAPLQPLSPAASPPAGGSVPAELPPAVPDLAGRAGEFSELWALAAEVAAGRMATASLAVLHGPPGIGKTSLAVAAGHRLASTFTGGQLFVDLQGAGQQGRIDPAEALAGFLRALGVPDERVPITAAERGALFRTLVRDRRILVVLDNAADEAQVRPLLPAGRHSLALVTSRRPLAGLEGAVRLPLDVLDPIAGRELLTSIVGTHRVAGASAATDRLVQLCGGLPLALRIAGNRLASRPQWSVERLVEQLHDQRHRLTVLTAGDLGIRSAFELSYRQLDPITAAVFRRASLIPGADFDAALIAAAAGTDDEVAAQAAEELVDAGLLLPLGDRYRFHDLVRLFAQERLDSDDPGASRTAAHQRLVGWLLRRTEQAGALFEPDATATGSPFEDHGAAGAWLAREAGNWPAALRDAARQGKHAEVIRVTRALHWYSDAASHRHAWDEIFSLGVTAAQAAGRTQDEATLLNFLGWARLVCRERFTEALAALDRALLLARRIGDRREEAWALTYTAAIRVRSGRAEPALTPCRRAAELFREIGYALGEHAARNVEGSALTMLGRHAEAARLHRAVLEFYRQGNGLSRTGALVAQANAMVCLGRDLAGLGRWREAADEYQRAAAVFRSCAASFNEAMALYFHATALRELGELPAAADLFRHALALFSTYSSPWWEAQTLHALAGLAEAGASVGGPDGGPDVGSDGGGGVGVEVRADARWLRQRALARCGELDTPQSRLLRDTLMRELAAG